MEKSVGLILLAHIVDVRNHMKVEGEMLKTLAEEALLIIQDVNMEEKKKMLSKLCWIVREKNNKIQFLFQDGSEIVL